MVGTYLRSFVLLTVIVVIVLLIKKNHHKRSTTTTTITREFFSKDERSWIHKKCDEHQNFLEATLKTPYGNTPIYVYPASQDPWVSGLLLDHGYFEQQKTSVMYELLNIDPDINLVDIGANIGVYTLSAVKMGRKVLAVEALDRNFRRICASTMGLRNVTLVYNAISNVSGKIVNLGIDKNNMGGTYVEDEEYSNHVKKLKEGRAQGTYGAVHTIKMDDLVKLPNFREYFSNVVIKMDIEGFEARAVEGASLFFESVNVVGVIMEWEYHKGQKKTTDTIIRFMNMHNFVPHELSTEKKSLVNVNPSMWGADVLWLPG